MKVAILTRDSREHFKDYDTEKPYFGTSPQALLQGLAKLPEVEIHVISCLKQPVQPLVQLAPNITYHGLHVPHMGWGRTLYSGCIRAARRKVNEIKPDLVHGQGSEHDCALSAARSGFPNIVTIHGNLRHIAKTVRAPMLSHLRYQAFLESWAIARTTGVICLTRHTRDQVQGRTPRTWVLPNAVDESFFEVARAERPDNSILCVAFIDVNKNQNALIRALDPVASASGLKLVFLGGGNPDDSYFREFQELVQARPWCAYEGFKKPEELKRRLATARMLVLPSLEENCPMSILEAMAVGAPVAASRVGGIPDLIDDGVNGALFDPRNEESIRSAIMRVFQNAEVAAKLAKAARERALQRHHPVHIAREHLRIYREALSVPS